MRSLFIICDVESLISAYGNKIINAIKTCTSKSESRLLYQLRKKPTVVLFKRQRKAKGEARINTFINMYLRAKLIIREKEDTESMPS